MPDLTDILCNPPIIGSFISGSLADRGRGDLTNGQIPYFHQLLCRWPNNIALKQLWQVWIIPENEDNFKRELTQLSNFEIGQAWQNETGFGEVWHDGVQRTVGCAYAHGMTGPGDSLGIDFAGINGSNQGFSNGPIANHRASFTPLTISFLETHSSLTDMVMRPWSIMTGHKGLFAYPNDESIKATIYLLFLARGGIEQDLVLRKAMTFYNAAPYNIEAEDYTYDGDQGVAYRRVEFAYNNYHVTDGSDLTGGSLRPR